MFTHVIQGESKSTRMIRLDLFSLARCHLCNKDLLSQTAGSDRRWKMKEMWIRVILTWAQLGSAAVPTSPWPGMHEWVQMRLAGSMTKQCLDELTQRWPTKVTNKNHTVYMTLHCVLPIHVLETLTASYYLTLFCFVYTVQAFSMSALEEFTVLETNPLFLLSSGKENLKQWILLPKLYSSTKFILTA